MDNDILAKLHKVQLEILDEFVRICEENNFLYFLDGGTLLGAIRHEGFIPWDDDIDVAMPRKDYEKFLDIYEETNDTNYYLLSQKSPANFLYYKPFAKFCKKGTTFAEEYSERKDYYGIFIDIFPYDNSIRLIAPMQKSFILFTKKLYTARIFYNKSRRKFKLFLSKIIKALLPLNLCEKLMRYSYMMFNTFNTKYITCFAGVYNIKKETKERSTIFPLAKTGFEGKNYCIPGNYDLFLRHLYGDYMQLPPVEKRTTHMPKYISFDESPAHLQNNGEALNP